MEKKIYDYLNYGIDLKKGYSYKNGEFKLGTVTHNMLFSLKSRNPSRFLDTLIESYAYLEKTIPIDIVEDLCDPDDVSMFQTLGYAFMIGLLS